MMPDLLRNLRSTVSSLSGRVEDVTMRAAAVDNGVCDLTAVISSLRSSTATQDDKAAFLKDAAERTEQFLDDVERIDEEAAEAIRQSKDDFYEKYDYLKPDCEKSGWESFWEGAKEWCKDHWKAIVTVVLVIAAVVIIVATAGTALGPLAALAVTLAKGVLIGTLVGGLMGGIVGGLSPNSTFLEGLESGAFGGAVGGLITGGLGSAVSAISGVAELTMAQSMLVGGFGDGVRRSVLLRNRCSVLGTGRASGRYHTAAEDKRPEQGHGQLEICMEVRGGQCGPQRQDHKPEGSVQGAGSRFHRRRTGSRNRVLQEQYRRVLGLVQVQGTSMIIMYE